MLVVRQPRIICALFQAWVFVDLCLPASVAAHTVWTGAKTVFTKDSDTDYTLPENQDPLTANVVFTRAETGGLINYAAEISYVHQTSPTDTLWATSINNSGKLISALNHANLSFTSWIDAYGGQFSGGSNIPGRDAVVHLLSDDIYLDLRFTQWTSTRGGCRRARCCYCARMGCGVWCRTTASKP